MERLEGRRLLTSTLYLDYGDGWAGGTLNTTVGAIDNTTNGSNPNIDGPRLSDAAGNDYADAVTVAITSILSLDPVNGAATRAAMTALTRRFFEPFDISVVDLTTTPQTVNGISVVAPANLNDASALLGQNEGAGENNDTYLLIGGFQINGTDNPNSNAFGNNAYGGLSTGTDINNDNGNDGTALVIFGGNGNPTFDGPQNVHEAGHAFGLEHVYRQDTGNPPPGGFGTGYDMLHQSEIMSYLGYATQGGFNFFSRFPVMDGDGNNDQNTLANSPTPYDDLVDDPNIGASGIEYVTGSGAHDIITITKTGATTANVTLQSFTDASYTTAIDFPGATGTSYSYSINTDRPLTIDAGGRNDRIVLDGDLGTTITLRGMQGTDQLIVMGKNAASALYTTGTNSANGLDGNADLRGSISIGGTTIAFQEFEAASSVTIQDVAALTYRTGGSDDALTLDSPAAGQMRLDGTSDGVDLVPLTFFNVVGLTIDAATNDGGVATDNVLLAASSLATGLTSIGVNTGTQNDLLRVNFTPGNPIPSGGLIYDGGGGTNDVLRLSGGSFTNEVYTATGPSSGTIALDASNITYSNLAPIEDTVDVINLTFNATGGSDLINVVNGAPVGGIDTTEINSGNGTFEKLSFANKANVTLNGLGGADVISLNANDLPADLVSLVVNGGANADTFNVSTTYTNTTLNGDGGADEFNVDATGAGTAFTVNGGDGGDRVNVLGAGLGAGSVVAFNGDNDADTFDVTSSSSVPIPVDGGAGNDTLKVNGETTLTYSFTTALGTTTFSASGRANVASQAVELLDVRNGTFTVVASVGPSVRVHGVDDGPAELNGTGVIAGTLTADAGSTVSPAVGSGVSGTLGAGSTSLNAGSTFFVNLNGITPGGQHDQLNVQGTVALNNADLAGTLNYVSIPGDELVIINNDGADPVLGKFAQGDMIVIGGKKFAIDYAFNGNDVALIRYGAELGPDPCDPNQLALFVSATTGNDRVLALPATGSSRIRVVIEALSQGFTDTFGPFDFKGQIIMMGQSGNDLVSSVAVPSRNVMLYGNVGNDTVVGGNNNGILLGNQGNDELVGGNGRDLLIGGDGADVLRGNNAGDILVATATTYDTNSVANRQALCEILHTWEHGGRQSTLLNSATVLDDLANDVDTLWGANGTDWFVLDANDAHDRDKKEQASDL